LSNDKEFPKIVIYQNGKVEKDTNFNRDALITLLRKELNWQKKLEELMIEEKVKQKIDEVKNS